MDEKNEEPSSGEKIEESDTGEKKACDTKEGTGHDENGVCVVD